MRLIKIQIVVVLCACALVAGDVAHLRGLKARLAGRHRKRGVLSGVPPYKLGHDIPLVTHSVVKPIVVTYPPTAAVHNVKVPLSHPLLPRPTPAEPHPSPPRGFKLPYHTRTVVVPRPESHFHHHHHHVAPRPLVPVVPAPPVVPATPIVPLPQQTVTIARPLPAPAPPLFVHPAPAAPPPLAIHPVQPAHPAPLTPLLPATALPVPPALPAAPHFSYVLRPGNAVQTSLFATYPRYPLLNYHQPLVPFPPPAAASLYVQRPQVPQFHVASAGVIPQPVPPLGVQPTPTVLQPVAPGVLSLGQVHGAHPSLVEHDGWAPLPTVPNPTFESAHEHAVHEQAAHNFAHAQAAAEHQQHVSEENNYHEYQHQLQHHIQQIEQAQYEQHLNQHHLGQEYGQPEQGYVQHGNDYAHQAQDFSQQAHDFAQHAQHGHDYVQNTQQAHDFAQHAQQAHDFAQHVQQAHDFAQQAHNFPQQLPDYTQHTQQVNDFAQHAHQAHDFGFHENDFSQHTQEAHDFAQQAQYAQHPQQVHEYAQHAQDFGGQQHPSAEYGPPQHLEGRSAEGTGDTGNMEEAGEGELRYHNHIPLGLQPPIDRPLDHFR